MPGSSLWSLFTHITFFGVNYSKLKYLWCPLPRYDKLALCVWLKPNMPGQCFYWIKIQFSIEASRIALFIDFLIRKGKSERNASRSFICSLAWDCWLRLFDLHMGLLSIKRECLSVWSASTRTSSVWFGQWFHPNLTPPYQSKALLMIAEFMN